MTTYADAIAELQRVLAPGPPRSIKPDMLRSALVAVVEAVRQAEEDAGTAAALMNAHVAEASPHPQYALASLIGAALGIAPLGNDAKVPSAFLPSYVDDVLEFNNLAAFPAVGEAGKIYIAKDTNISWRWSGSTYSDIKHGEVQSIAGLVGVITAAALKTALALAAGDISGLGNAAQKNTGTATGNVVEVLAGGKLPVLDASNLINVPSAAGVSTAVANVWTALQTFTASLLINNNQALQGKTAAGATVNLAQIDSADTLIFGAAGIGHMVFRPGTGKQLRLLNAAMTAYIAAMDEATRKTAFGSNSFDGLVTFYDNQAGGDTVIAVRDGAAGKARLKFGDNAGTYDVGLTRDSAGVLEVNSVTAGTLRDLKLRNLFFADGSSLSSKPSGVPDVVIEDQKTSGSYAGLTSGQWATRDLNTLVRNVGTLVTLASNAFTITVPGTYFVAWECPLFDTLASQTKLYNVTDAADAGRGRSLYGANSGTATDGQSAGVAVVTIAAAKAFEIRHYAQQGLSTGGGNPCSQGTEVFSRVKIWKIS